MRYVPLSEELTPRPEHKARLQQQTIDERHPGAILHDFDMLLDYARDKKLRVTTTHLLPLKSLSKINDQLVQPVKLGLKRPQQRSFPSVHGLYLLLRASGLTYIDSTGKTPKLVVGESVYESWSGLNPTERYCVLLDAWLLRGRPEIIREHGRRGLIPENFQEAAMFYVGLPGDDVSVAGNRHIEEKIRFDPGLYNVALMDLFGIIRAEQGKTIPGQGWQIARIHRTPFGTALLTVLYTDFFEKQSRRFYYDEEDVKIIDGLKPALQPYFPAWQNSLAIPERSFRPGAYTFKVTLGERWSRIVIGAKSLLDVFAATIINSVEFDHDHLYQFTYETRFGFPQSINHPYLGEGDFTSEVRVGDVPIRVGQTMTFLYDFGDNWEFDVTLEQVEADKTITEPRIIETHGEPPEQYHYW